MTEQSDTKLEYVLQTVCGSCGRRETYGRTHDLAEALAWQKQFKMAQAAQQRGDKHDDT